MSSKSSIVPYSIENQIVLVRGQKILLDADLAVLYGVEVRALIQAVKRNEKRFPSDFVFQLTAEENEALRSQIVISKSSRGGRRYAPYAFTEHGAIMAASVLNSPRAVEMSIYVVRAFLRL
ncbi:MAG TPA: ORF6N domain-containing protein, partial [Terracidiphilus sp.]|nr:ORF6N domain-containing protein [Terracidiphilus sp.]